MFYRKALYAVNKSKSINFFDNLAMHQLTMVAFNYMSRSLRIFLFCIGLSLVVGFTASWYYSETNYYLPDRNGPMKISRDAYYEYRQDSPEFGAYTEEDFNIQKGIVWGGITLGASFLIASLVFRKPSSNGSVSV